jgi:hypothetical protein
MDRFMIISIFPVEVNLITPLYGKFWGKRHSTNVLFIWEPKDICAITPENAGLNISDSMAFLQKFRHARSFMKHGAIDSQTEVQLLQKGAFIITAIF